MSLISSSSKYKHFELYYGCPDGQPYGPNASLGRGCVETKLQARTVFKSLDNIEA